MLCSIHDESFSNHFSLLISYEFSHSTAISTPLHNGLKVGKWKLWKIAYSERPILCQLLQKEHIAVPNQAKQKSHLPHAEAWPLGIWDSEAA
jgi:hypothetical protein